MQYFLLANEKGKAIQPCPFSLPAKFYEADAHQIKIYQIKPGKNGNGWKLSRYSD